MSATPSEGEIYLEDITLDATIDCGRFSLTEQAIIDFAAQYDPQPFHLSREAGDASIFGGLVASSTQSLAVSCGVLVRALAGVKIVGGVAWEDIKLFRPVWPGRDYAVRARWTATRPSASKPDRGIANIAIDVLEGDAVVMTYGIAYIVSRRP